MHLNASPRKFQRKKGDESHLTHNEGYDSDEVLLMATIKISEDQNDEWYLDTRCLNYMTGKKS